MQTLSKTKAKEFAKLFGLDPELQDEVERLLREHERDTRYTAIDIVQSMDDEVNYENSFDVINRDETVKLLHNLKVGF